MVRAKPHWKTLPRLWRLTQTVRDVDPAWGDEGVELKDWSRMFGQCGISEEPGPRGISGADVRSSESESESG